MQKELYLFIIWQNGRFMEKQIIADLRKKFEIFRIFEVSWKEENFALNLARFYGKKLPKGCKKEKETGAGAFKVCLVYDNNPQYADGKNANIVKSKQDYRQLTGGGNLVHASDNPAETNENLLFLFGKPSKTWNRKARGRKFASSGATWSAAPCGTVFSRRWTP